MPKAHPTNQRTCIPVGFGSNLGTLRGYTCGPLSPTSPWAEIGRSLSSIAWPPSWSRPCQHHPRHPIELPGMVFPSPQHIQLTNLHAFSRLLATEGGEVLHILHTNAQIYIFQLTVHVRCPWQLTLQKKSSNFWFACKDEARDMAAAMNKWINKWIDMEDHGSLQPCQRIRV